MTPADPRRERARDELRQASLELEQRLRAGQPCRAEDLLAALPALAAHAEAALELIYTEFVVREELGQHPVPAEWYERFADRREDLRQIFEVHRFVNERTAADLVSSSRTSPPREAAPLVVRRPGRRVGSYEILEEIGRGGMGVVYKARHEALDRLVALKMILAGADAGPGERARFRREAEAVARLSHPNIVPVYEVGEQEGMAFLALEYVDGGSLAQRLDSTPLPGPESAVLVETLARAVHYAHQRGIIHRDLKPANILLTTETQRHREDKDREEETRNSSLGGCASVVSLTPKITDFGLAKRLDSHSGLTQTQALVGTPSYMAPEQGSRDSPIGPAADVYSLGAILYELLTGRPPFRAETVMDTVLLARSQEPTPPRRLEPRVPRDLETICLLCLRKEPQRRYATAWLLAEDLRRYRAGEPIQARPVGAVERAWKWARRRPTLAALVLVIMLAAAGMLVGGLWYNARLAAALQTATSERARALANFNKARDAVDRMLSQVGDSRWRNEPRLEKQRKALLTQALAFYEGFLKENGDDPAIRLETARAAARVGSIHAQLGEPAKAEEAYASAVALLDALVAEFPDERTYRHELSRCLGSLAHAQRRQGNPQQAETVYRRAIAVAQQLLAESPSDVPCQILLANHLLNLTVVLCNTSRLPEALQEAQRAVELEQAALRSRANDASCRSELALGLDQVSRLLQAQNRLPEAETYWRQSLELRQRLNAAFPHSATYRETLARSHAHGGDLARQAGHAEVAGRSYREAVALLEPLARDFPDTPDYQIQLAGCALRLGETLFQTDQLAGAAEAYQVAVTAYEKLAADAAEPLSYQGTLAECCNYLAWVLASSPDPGVRDAPRAIELVTRALELMPGDAACWNTLAVACYRRGDWDRARAAADRALELRGDNAYDLLLLALVQARRGDRAAAGTFFDRAVRESEKTPALTADWQPLWKEAAALLSLPPPASSDKRPASPFRALPPTQAASAERPDLFGEADSFAWQDRARRPTAPGEDAPPPSARGVRSAEPHWIVPFELGDYAMAARLLQVRLTQEPRSIRLLERLAWCHVALGAPAEASRALDRAIQLGPERAEECSRLAWALAAAPPPVGDVHRALPLAQKAAELDHTDTEALSVLAFVCSKLDSRAEAVTAFHQAAERAASDPEVWYICAGGLLLVGDEAGYRRLCERGLERWGGTTDGRTAYLVARACLLAPGSVADPARSRLLAEQAIRAAPQFAWYLHTRGLAFYRAGQPAQAIAQFRESSEVRPGWKAHVVNWLGLALAYQQHGDRAEAQRWLAKATAALDRLAHEAPRIDLNPSGLHPHDWLACMILRREAEARIPR